jgi:hypothetical protein
MTVAEPEQIELIDLSEEHEFEIPCDGPRIWPERIAPHNAPAEWIGIKACGHSRLLCTACKDLYLRLGPLWASFRCVDCTDRAGDTKFITFEALNGKA